MAFEMMRLHSYDEFQTWLARDLEVRDELDAMIGEPLGIALESLDVLEAFLLARFRSSDESLTLDQRNVIDAAARHIGLVMILNVDGAEWSIDLENTGGLYHRLPIIRLADGTVECPLSMATACLQRRRGDYLRSIVENYAEAYNGATPE